VTHRSTSVEQTRAIAMALAKTLAAGDCIALHGELGAGKTHFVRGLVEGLNGPIRQVSSPTFVLLQIYAGGRLSVYHFDAYRAHGSADFEGIGFSEILDQGGVVAVEWAERIEPLLPAKRIDIRIDSPDETTRLIQIDRVG
jgi:tRNA threonylcarbamoyladenosine biosynthesis protein TsaE